MPAASTLNAMIPGRVLKNDVEPVGADPWRAARTRLVGPGVAATSRATICAADAAIVGDGVLAVPPSPATAGSGTSDVMTTSKTDRAMCQPDFVRRNLIEKPPEPSAHT